MAAIIFNVLPLIPYLSVLISFSFLWVGRQGFSLLRRRPLRRFRALRAALANARAFTQLRAPRRVRTHERATKKDSQPKLTAFYSMLEHPEGASELVFSLPFMLSKHLSTFAVSCFEDLPCLSLLSMSVWK